MNPSDIDNYRTSEKRLWDHYGVAPAEHFIHLPKFNSKVRVLEIGQGEPVLFVHGSPNAGPKWTPLAAKLSDFRCLILDRPGCGLSEPVDYQDRNLRAFGVDLLDQTLDGLDLPKVNMVASSLGGTLAFYFTHAHPERVMQLVQEGCPAFVQGFHVPLYNIIGSVISLLFGKVSSSRAAFRHIGHAASIDRGQFEFEVLAWRDALLKYTDTQRHEDSLSRRLASKSREYTYGKDFLRQIIPPTLYLWGEDDPFGGIDLGKRLAAAQPAATFTSFPEAGHLPWLDDPETHADLIRGFLRDDKGPLHD